MSSDWSEKFDSLLAAFVTKRVTQLPAVKAESLSNLAGLLGRFTAAHARASVRVRLREADHAQRCVTVLEQFTTARAAHFERQRVAADDFNLLEVLQLTGKEVRHSMVLAWLLDCDPAGRGSHAQGPMGFRLFLREIGLPLSYADEPYFVRREVAGDDAIIDIEVIRPGGFLIHIENKIWSSEGLDQTDREWADLVRRAASAGLSATAAATNVHALYLTPQGSRPVNSNFRPISWKQIVRVLEQFALRAAPPHVRLFAEHYAAGLRRFVINTSRG